MSEQPYLSLNFYSFGVTLRRREGDKITEHPIDPAQAAVALAAKVTFNTGLLTGDTLYIHMEGVSKTVVEYRKPQITGIFLDENDVALRVPLPGLLMIRKTNGDKAPSYGVYAVKRRPKTLDVALFHAPLPNVFNSAAVCWGTVQRVSDTALAGASLAEDWQAVVIVRPPLDSRGRGRGWKCYNDGRRCGEHDRNVDEGIDTCNITSRNYGNWAGFKGAGIEGTGCDVAAVKVQKDLVIPRGHAEAVLAGGVRHSKLERVSPACVGGVVKLQQGKFQERLTPVLYPIRVLIVDGDPRNRAGGPAGVAVNAVDDGAEL